MRRSVLTAAVLAPPNAPISGQTPRNTTRGVIQAGRLVDGEAGDVPPGSRGSGPCRPSGRGRGAVTRLPGARVYDVRRYTVLPGLIDAHMHLLYLEAIGGGLTMEGMKAVITEGLALRALFACGSAGMTAVQGVGSRE